MNFFKNIWESLTIKNIVDFFKNPELSTSNKINYLNGKIIKLDSTIIEKNSTAVENYDGVLEFICADVKRSIKLTTYLKKELTELFGPHNTRFKGEFFYYVWIVQFNGEIFQIYTANGKGTQFAIVGQYEDDKSEICIAFLSKMEELLN